MSILQWLILGGLSFSPNQGNPQCPSQNISYGYTQVQQLWYKPSEKCFVTINYDYYPAPQAKRSYLFANTGILMVFNSYGDGPVSTDTGARVFYFFPRLKNPQFFHQNNSVFVAHSNDRLVQFDQQTAQMTFMESAEITVDPDVNRHNKGGVEITKYNGTLLDLGFNMGSDPKMNPNGKAIFSNPRGFKCTLKNKEIFDYSGDEPILKFDSEAKIVSVVRSKCPNF